MKPRICFSKVGHDIGGLPAVSLFGWGGRGCIDQSYSSTLRHPICVALFPFCPMSLRRTYQRRHRNFVDATLHEHGCHVCGIQTPSVRCDNRSFQWQHGQGSVPKRMRTSSRATSVLVSMHEGNHEDRMYDIRVITDTFYGECAAPQKSVSLENRQNRHMRACKIRGPVREEPTRTLWIATGSLEARSDRPIAAIRLARAS